MNIAILGYIAYFFITVFNPLQLAGMVRGKNLNLGAWPLVSLVLGLTLLSISFWFAPVGVPTYVAVGTAVSLAGCAANLLLVLRQSKPTQRAENEMEAYAREMLRYVIPSSVMRRFIKQRNVDNFVRQMSKAFSRGEEAYYGAVTNTSGPAQPPPPSLSRADFATCKECTGLVFKDEARKVDIAVRDVAGVIGGFGGKFEDSIGTVRSDYYCQFDGPEYDRQVFYPGDTEGIATTVEYFKYVPSKYPPVDGSLPRKVLKQVNEDGSDYD